MFESRKRQKRPRLRQSLSTEHIPTVVSVGSRSLYGSSSAVSENRCELLWMSQIFTFFPSNLSTRLKWQSAKKSQLQFPASLARQVLPKNQLAQLKMSPTHERSITRPFGSHSPFRHWRIDPFCDYVLQVALFFQSLVKRKSPVPGVGPPPCYTRRLLRMSMPGDFDFLNFLNFAVSRKKFLQCVIQ